MENILLRHDSSFEYIFMALTVGWLRSFEEMSREDKLKNFVEGNRKFLAARNMIGKIRKTLNEQGHGYIEEGFITSKLLENPEENKDTVEFQKITLNIDGELIEVHADD